MSVRSPVVCVAIVLVCWLFVSYVFAFAFDGASSTDFLLDYCCVSCSPFPPAGISRLTTQCPLHHTLFLQKPLAHQPYPPPPHLHLSLSFDHPTANPFLSCPVFVVPIFRLQAMSFNTGLSFEIYDTEAAAAGDNNHGNGNGNGNGTDNNNGNDNGNGNPGQVDQMDQDVDQPAAQAPLQHGSGNVELQPQPQQQEQQQEQERAARHGVTGAGSTGAKGPTGEGSFSAGGGGGGASGKSPPAYP